MLAISRFLRGLAYTALFLAAVHGAFMVGRQAYVDYGWLGLLVILALGVPFFWLVPLIGWWFLPTSQMIWLVIFIGIFLISTWGSAAFERMSLPQGPY